jgi:antitoxin (DNA-binding transcriptional repressor) of toxin-antitoxin stability system
MHKSEVVMITKTVNIRDMKSQLNAILSLVSQGNTVVISENNKALAKIVPVSDHTTKRRRAGLNQGKIWTSDDFDDSLPDDFWMGSL